MLANIVLAKKKSDASVLVVPADHYIPDEDTFARQMTDALKFARNKVIVTSGIKPTMPHKGYGYINFKKENSSQEGGTAFYPVSKFEEKPDIEIARQYLAAGNYHWNSGMFIWRADSILRAIEKNIAEIHECLLEYDRSIGTTGEYDARCKLYYDCADISIDFAVL